MKTRKKSSNLSEAIGSAARDVRKAGFEILRVEIEADDLEEWPDCRRRQVPDDEC